MDFNLKLCFPVVDLNLGLGSELELFILYFNFMLLHLNCFYDSVSPSDWCSFVLFFKWKTDHAETETTSCIFSTLSKCSDWSKMRKLSAINPSLKVSHDPRTTQQSSGMAGGEMYAEIATAAAWMPRGRFSGLLRHGRGGATFHSPLISVAHCAQWCVTRWVIISNGKPLDLLWGRKVYHVGARHTFCHAFHASPPG